MFHVISRRSTPPQEFTSPHFTVAIIFSRTPSRKDLQCVAYVFKMINWASLECIFKLISLTMRVSISRQPSTRVGRGGCLCNVLRALPLAMLTSLVCVCPKVDELLALLLSWQIQRVGVELIIFSWHLPGHSLKGWSAKYEKCFGQKRLETYNDVFALCRPSKTRCWGPVTPEGHDGCCFRSYLGRFFTFLCSRNPGYLRTNFIITSKDSTTGQIVVQTQTFVLVHGI